MGDGYVLARQRVAAMNAGRKVACPLNTSPSLYVTKAS
jgi:hypothetical protein